MSDLTEPLLGGRTDGGAAGPAPAALPPSARRPAAPPAPLPWWRRLLRKLAALLDDLLDFIHWRLRSPRPRAIEDLPLVAAERLGALRRRAAAPYDAALAEHRAHLRRLWEAAFPGDPFPPEIRSERWKEMGWQRDDPGSDFRGGGFLALELLVAFAEGEPDEFEALMAKKRGSRADWEYPFGAAGVNVTFTLIEVLELRGGDGVPGSPAARGFLRLLAAEEGALESVFAEALVALDGVWLERRAGYMQFPAVLAETRRRVERALGRRWVRTPADLAAALHGG